MSTLIERVQDKQDEMTRISQRLDGQNNRIGNLEDWRYSVDNDLNHLKAQAKATAKVLNNHEH